MYYLCWSHFYKGTQGLIFVVQSNDLERIEEVAEKLQLPLSDEAMRGVPVLVYANKMDLPGALTTTQISEHLGLSSLHDRRWHI